jgi:DNA-binding NarL/FixJ family response regulator
MADPISLWLVEDELSYRQSFEDLVATTTAFVLAGAFETAEDAAACEGAPPDLVVMDLQLPGADGIEGTRRLRSRWPTLPVVVLTLVDRAETIARALRAGASGYIVKGSEPDDIFRSLSEAHAGGTYFAPNVARHLLGIFASPGPDEPLTDREIEVLRALADGLTKSGIADRLFLSPHTVDSHLRSVYAKLHARNAAEATARAIRSGLI